jgi:hypothetical protein
MWISAGSGLVRLPEQDDEKLNVKLNDVTSSPETLKLTGVPCPVVPVQSPAYPAGTRVGSVGPEQAAGHAASNTPSHVARIDRIVYSPTGSRCVVARRGAADLRLGPVSERVISCLTPVVRSEQGPLEADSPTASGKPWGPLNCLSFVSRRRAALGTDVNND